MKTSRPSRTRLAVLLSLTAACSRTAGGGRGGDAEAVSIPRSTPPAPPARAPSLTERLSAALPARIPPFAASPLLVEKTYVRRHYTQRDVDVEVTIARTAGERADTAAEATAAYQRWLADSKAYPQASLPLPSADANGFFTCAGDGPRAACDLHVELRAGFHVEMMGGGHATRADLQSLIWRIPLAALVD